MTDCQPPDETTALVEVTRGLLLDTLHRGALAVVDASGETVAAIGGPATRVAYWRSSAKPFQSMPLVYTGAAERFGLEPRDLAICCGSHSGEPEHTELVTDLLGRVGLRSDSLACGTHPPLHRSSAEALLRRGDQPTSLHHNCSGLQTGMLILAAHLGVHTHGYEAADHPVQREILANVSRFTGVRPDDIVMGIDGCNVPTFGISVERMALAYARLMQPEGAVENRYNTPAATIRGAMMAHPFNVAGTGRLDTELMTAGEGRVVSKGGAGGVQCVGLGSGIGFAVKMDDGEAGPLDAVRPKAVATLAALRQLDLIDYANYETLSSHATPAVTTATGALVGEARPAFELARSGSAGSGTVR